MAAKKGWYLQDIDKLGDGCTLLPLMDIGQYGNAKVLANFSEDRKRFPEAEPTFAIPAGPIRLVEARLVNQPDARTRGDLLKSGCHL